MKVRPLYRVLVKMVPMADDHLSNMGPTLKGIGLQVMDKKKHWEHSARRGVIVALPDGCSLDAKVGDVVWFQGAAGFTLDGDIMDEGLETDRLKGESFRWLKAKEIEAVDETVIHPINEGELLHA